MRFEQFENSGAQLPTRATTKSAGYDLRALESVTLERHCRELVGTGVCWEDVPSHLWGEIKSRSSLAHKKKLDVKAGVIDADYKGEIMVLLKNDSHSRVTVKAGERIAQLVIQRYETVSDDTSCNIRDGGFGSTGSS